MLNWVKLLVMGMILFLTSCKPDDDTTPIAEESTEPSAYAVIDGIEHNFNYYSAGTDFAHYTLYFACCEGQGIDLEFAGTKTGTYNVGGNSHSVFLYYTKEGIKYTSPNSQQIYSGSITKIDTTTNTISGTFEFEGCRTTGDCIKVLKGSFKNIPIN